MNKISIVPIARLLVQNHGSSLPRWNDQTRFLAKPKEVRVQLTDDGHLIPRFGLFHPRPRWKSEIEAAGRLGYYARSIVSIIPGGFSYEWFDSQDHEDFWIGDLIICPDFHIPVQSI